MYEIFERLLKEKSVTAYRVSKETGIGASTFSDWKSGRSTPKQEKLQKIADYFGVSVDYLMTGKEDTPKETTLTSRDERDIKNTIDSLMEKLDSNDGAPLYFDGQELSPETKILFEAQLETLVRTVKKINKEKYNPNKNKK